jgi:hypothetical protein
MATELESALLALTARYGGGYFQRARTLQSDSFLPERSFALEQFEMMA